MTVGLVVQVVVTGLAVGATYGLVAMGFALVHRLTGVLELAHGDLLGGAVFLGLVVSVGTGPVGRDEAGTAAYLAGVVVALVAAAIAGALLYLAILRPSYRRRSTSRGALGWIGATAAVAFAIEGILAAAFSREAYVFPDPLRFDRLGPIDLGGGATLPVRTLWVLGVGVVVALVARRVLERSTFGDALSAIASEPMGAAAVGLPVDRLVAAAFALAGVLAAVAGVVVAPSRPIGPSFGLVLGLKGIAAAVLGGLASPGRVFAAGLAIGVLEGAVASLHVPGLPSLGLGPAWRDIAPLLLVLGVLAVRPPRGALEPIE